MTSPAVEYTSGIEVCVINLETGKVLDHYYGNSIQAYNDDTQNPAHRWIIKKKEGGQVIFKNVGTGKVLDHFAAKFLAANNADEDDAHHRWLLIPSLAYLGTFTIVNVATGKNLDHYNGSSIEATMGGEVPNRHHMWWVVPTNSFIEKMCESAPMTFSTLMHQERRADQVFPTSQDAVAAICQDICEGGSMVQLDVSPTFANEFPLGIYMLPSGELVGLAFHTPHEFPDAPIADRNTGQLVRTLHHFHVRTVSVLEDGRQNGEDGTYVVNLPLREGRNRRPDVRPGTYLRVDRHATHPRAANHYFVEEPLIVNRSVDPSFVWPGYLPSSATLWSLLFHFRRFYLGGGSNFRRHDEL